MDVHSFVEQEWRAGNRDQAMIARKYVAEATAQQEPALRFNALYGPVYAAVAQEFAYQRKVDTDHRDGTPVGAQDTINQIREEENRPPFTREVEPVTPVSPVQHAPSPLEQRQRYLGEKVWVIRGSGRVKVHWTDVTVADADATAGHLLGMLTGIRQSIGFFTDAKNLMVKYGAQRLGDVPEEVARELMGADSTRSITSGDGHPEDGEPVHALNP
jgi:hypothetical protein